MHAARRFCPFRTLLPALAALAVAALPVRAAPLDAPQPPPKGPPSLPADGPITFPYKNYSDLRGLLNAFLTFRRACLDQPVSEGLPQRLLPEGYGIVPFTEHLFGTKQEDPPKGHVVLSKTGSEEQDFAGGHLIVHLSLPDGASPGGECRVVWNRAWDYPDPVDDIVLAMGVQFNVWVSYYLRATRISRPEHSFTLAKRYGMLGDWAAPCWQAEPCAFKTLGWIDPERGIELIITRD